MSLLNVLDFFPKLNSPSNEIKISLCSDVQSLNGGSFSMHVVCVRTPLHCTCRLIPPVTGNLKRRHIQSFRVPIAAARQQHIEIPAEDTAPLSHIPVMRKEVIDMFAAHVPAVDSAAQLKILDFTFGSGGHTSSILHAFPRAHVYAVDRDPVAIDIARNLSKSEDSVCYRRLTPLHCKFSDIAAALSDCGEHRQDQLFDAVLIDAGCSSMQFDDAKRGFSLSKDAPLDMRMGGRYELDTLTAADLVNNADEQTLARILKNCGEERMSKKIARHIVEYRSTARGIKSTSELANIVAAVKCGFGFGGEQHDIRGPAHKDLAGRFQHPATLTFQALRIFVNDELNELDFALHYAYHALKQNGIAVALTFHSLEDAIVKDHFTNADTADNIYYARSAAVEQEEQVNSNSCSKPVKPKFSPKLVNLSYRSGTKTLSPTEMETFSKQRWSKINKRVLLPMFDEIERNPRSRSAKLRAAVKS